MKRIDEIIIISEYECSCYLTVWYKGKEDTAEIEDIERCFKSYTSGRFLAYVFDKYGCDVLLCSDGGIQYFKCDVAGGG